MAFMDKVKQKLGIYPYNRIESGVRGRDSYVDPQDRRDRGFMPLIEPDEKKQFRLQQLSVKELYRMTAAEAIEKLINSSDALSLAVELYVNHSVRGFTIEGEDRAKAVIEDFIERQRRRGIYTLTTLKRKAYGIYVEGASCSELIFSDDGVEATKIDYVSPLSLSFEKAFDDDLGEYFLVGQRNRFGKLDPILKDEANPQETDTFIYNPFNVRGNKPYGSSQVSPALFSTTSLTDIVKMMVNWMQGQVFPKGVYQVDTETMSKAGFTAKQIQEEANRATQLIQGKLSAADITQDIVLSTPILFTLVGMLEKSGIDGIEMITNMLERIQRRALKVPSVLFGSQSRQQSLNNTDANYELLDFFLRIIAVRMVIEDDMNEHFLTITRHSGLSETAQLKLDDDDELLSLVFAQIMKTQGEAFNAFADLGIVDKQEMRTTVVRFVKAFRGLDNDLPDTLENGPMRDLRISQPTSTPEGTNDE